MQMRAIYPACKTEFLSDHLITDCLFLPGLNFLQFTSKSYVLTFHVRWSLKVWQAGLNT